VQGAIVAQLTADTDTVAAIEPGRMDALVQELLEPLSIPTTAH
jgi:hypothetical protein